MPVNLLGTRIDGPGGDCRNFTGTQPFLSESESAFGSVMVSNLNHTGGTDHLESYPPGQDRAKLYIRVWTWYRHVYTINIQIHYNMNEYIHIHVHEYI